MKKMLRLSLTLFLILCLLPISAFADYGMVSCVNCTVNGEYYWSFDRFCRLTAVADIPDGWSIQGWKINGVLQAPGRYDNVLVFEARGNMTVECVASADGEAEPLDGAMNRVDIVTTPVPTAAPTAEPVVTFAPTAEPEIDLPVVESLPPEDDDEELDGEGFDGIAVNGEDDDFDDDDDWGDDDWDDWDEWDEGELVVTAVGCKLQLLDKNNKAAGDKMTEIDFSSGYYNPNTKQSISGYIDFCATADVSNVEYWVINGTRYDFEGHAPKAITVRDLEESMTLEAVGKNAAATTVLSAEDVTGGSTRVIKASKNAKLCFVTDTDRGAGGWKDSFDFTNDYVNAATEKGEQGGRVTMRVKAEVDNSKKLDYWVINGVRFYFDTAVESFIVRDLTRSTTYAASISTRYFTVSANGCSVSPSGRVAYGTTVTVRANCDYPVWTQGHSGTDKSFTYVVTSNVTFSCYNNPPTPAPTPVPTPVPTQAPTQPPTEPPVEQ